MDINNCLNEVLSSFNSLNKELSSGFHLVDTFSNCFSFISVNQKDTDTLKSHCNRLDKFMKTYLLIKTYLSLLMQVSRIMLLSQSHILHY